MEYLIVSPIGGFGNHIRWLMLLDDKFNLFDDVVVASRWDRKLYNDLKGGSWPIYGDFNSMPMYVKHECHELLPSIFLKYDNNINGKSSFIMEHVYPNNRTWHNWLQTEWGFRDWADGYISFSHNLDHEYIKNTIAVTIEPEFAYKRYLKFNSCNNNQSKEQTISEIEKYNCKIHTNTVSNRIIIDANVIYDEHLNYELYTRCIEAFSLTNNYQDACVIHKQWHQLHQNAEIDIVQDIINMYKK
jgi:hypothetical protein